LNKVSLLFYFKFSRLDTNRKIWLDNNSILKKYKNKKGGGYVKVRENYEYLDSFYVFVRSRNLDN